ncbi:unnamed protein product [Ambrosiozyma monospora]|uniref:Unnamed protein product n=1 Tax=Ambrosiozyma monospora TaxID=43982 RepID=A0ACB5T208_AMBMO|nr:unnamed protein product [Ambrosiozyma monospora]
MPGAVLVSGSNGFIAGHLVDGLLAKGYPVIGTVRSMKKSEPFLKYFEKKYPEGKIQYVIVERIDEEGAFDQVFKDHPEIEYVMHCAASTAIGTTKEAELKNVFLKASVNGTLSILKSIKKLAPQVKNVVMTSSIAAMAKGNFTKGDESYVLNNKSWNDSTWEQAEKKHDQLKAYAVAKTTAERSAWDFVKNEKVNFKFSTVNPNVVVGPQLMEEQVDKVLNSSNQWIIDAVQKVNLSSTSFQVMPVFGIVDVKDVVNFHIFAIEQESMAGWRLLLQEGPFISTQSILNSLNENVPQLRGKIAKGDPTETLDPKLVPKIDVSNVLETAGDYKLTPIDETLKALFEQYLKHHTLEVAP